VCNLYPFQETLRKEGVTESDITEQIDIGGVTLLRAAAKNFESVVVASNPDDYAGVLEKLRGGSISLTERKNYALKAFRHTSTYDRAISQWFSASLEEGKNEGLPKHITLAAEKVETLRYGENPHQQGALYRWVGADTPFVQVSGKELSYNNILDLDVAYTIVQEFSDPCAVIIKHNTPCGIATDTTSIVTAYQKAFESDTVSAFGSIIAVNREVTVELCEAIGKLFLEVLVSHAYTKEALAWLSEKKKNCRVLIAKKDTINKQQTTQEGSLVIRSVFGGLLVQTPDNKGVDGTSAWKVVTKAKPTPEMEKGLAFAWLACKHVKSNAIVLVQGTATVGIGTGQPNRVDSVIHSAKRAGEKAKRSLLGSDAFFPFPDGIEEAAKAGVIAVIQPGGSIRDDDVIAKADELGLVMVFTGERHFKH